ncbi:hypothetical protein DGG96_19625 [Legionella qingyii]|uniref:Cytochrome b/b6 C-terminal region profile domain-containing protein n=1 Tax=Legionella qingyii TaxID=2184757 RepID=A0A317U0P2_9GAMM|nr:hypothetical protein DGG96_19625 [Legionella qingyii]RUR18635.1 hypothetical protein ELY20_16390 [Legionella qingyii]RUR26866.1 hypothetical protein ELY16_06415 [Legionella qingyii]
MPQWYFLHFYCVLNNAQENSLSFLVFLGFQEKNPSYL